MLGSRKVGEETSPCLRQWALERLEEQAKSKIAAESSWQERPDWGCVLKPGYRARCLRSRKLEGHTRELGRTMASGGGKRG